MKGSVVIFPIQKSSSSKSLGNTSLQNWSLETNLRLKAYNKVQVDLLCQNVHKIMKSFLKTVGVETTKYDLAI
jgi:hypothetical protein